MTTKVLSAEPDCRAHAGKTRKRAFEFPQVDDIRTPLFIAHGGDDPRVTPAESELVYAALRGRGHDCELMRVDHEGHGFARLRNREKVYGAMMRFIESRCRRA